MRARFTCNCNKVKFRLREKIQVFGEHRAATSAPPTSARSSSVTAKRWRRHMPSIVPAVPAAKNLEAGGAAASAASAANPHRKVIGSSF